MAESAWLVGSHRFEASGIEVNGVGVATPSGDLYLRHSNDLLSLAYLFQAVIQSQVATATVFITRGRTVRILPAPGDPVSIDWLANTQLRDLLGFDANLASSDDPHDAPAVSPLLWSPGWVATPETLLGTEGFVLTDQSWHVSADGSRTLTTTFYEQVQQNLAWTEIRAERMRVRSGDPLNGTFHGFYESVLKLGSSIRYYEAIDELDDSTTAVTWDDAVYNSFGPYVLRERNPQWYRRVLANADLYSPLDLPLMMVGEYS